MSVEKFEYFMERTEEDLGHIRMRVDTLWDFRMRIIGGNVAISIIVSAVVSILTIYFGRA